MTPLDFWDVLRLWCAIFDASVTSYGRTQKRNADVGGVAQSPHRYWVAADVVYDVPPTDASVSIHAHRLGLKVIRADDHDHLQPADWLPG